MIFVDKKLVSVARHMITGANVHRINTLIFQYEQSVAIHNSRGRSVTDPRQFEQRLRELVCIELRQRIAPES